MDPSAHPIRADKTAATRPTASSAGWKSIPLEPARAGCGDDRSRPSSQVFTPLPRSPITFYFSHFMCKTTHVCVCLNDNVTSIRPDKKNWLKLWTSQNVEPSQRQRIFNSPFRREEACLLSAAQPVGPIMGFPPLFSCSTLFSLLSTTNAPFVHKIAPPHLISLHTCHLSHVSTRKRRLFLADRRRASIYSSLTGLFPREILT